MYTTLISVPQLQSLQASGQPLMVFDCSFELMQAGVGDQQYQQAHIPGAVRADLDRHLSANKAARDAASGGRHPLPSRETISGWLSSIGFTNDMQAVVYDRQGANYCGRLWWMLKHWLGHAKVAVLDGGYQRWVAQGHLPTPAALRRVNAVRAATPGKTVIARAECYQVRRSMAFVRGIAHDGDASDPVAHTAGIFMLVSSEGWSKP